MSEALTREKNFFFAICQIIPLENEVYVAKTLNDLVKNLPKCLF